MEKLLDEFKGKSIVIGTHGNIMTIIMNHYNKEYGFVYDYDDFDNNSVQIKLLNNIIISAVAEWCDITFKFQDLMKKSFEIKLPNNKQLKLIK